ncbi:MAG: MFS transporter [Firmicutes bacterium]|nr:MFS transporter [Bacillota bacterium]
MASTSSPSSPSAGRQAVYPWLICGCGLVLVFCTNGLCGNNMPVYFPFLAQEKGFNNAQLSLITTLRCGFAFITMGLLPRLLKKASVRLLALTTCLCLAASLVVMSLADTLPVLYLAAAGIGVTYGMGSMVLVSVLVRSWFRRREGFALGLCAAGSGLANLIAAPSITYAVEHVGLASAMRLEALAALPLGLLLFLVIRDKPAQLGLEPYGSGGDTEEVRQDDASAHPAVQMSPRHKKLMLAAMLATGPINIATPSYYTLHFTNCGYAPMTVAAGLSMFGLILTLAKLVYGWANDRFGVYRCNWFFLGLNIIANVLVAFAGRVPTGPFIFIAFGISAFSYPPMMIGFSLWARDLCEPEEYTKKVALYQQLTTIGGMLSSPLGGVSADLTGGYTCAYLGGVLLMVFTLLTLQYLYRSYGRDRAGIPPAEQAA